MRRPLFLAGFEFAIRGVGDGRLVRSHCAAGGGMDRVRRLIAVLFVVCFAGVAVAGPPSGQPAGTYGTQGQAYSACSSRTGQDTQFPSITWTCVFQSGADSGPSPGTVCYTNNLRSSGGAYYWLKQTGDDSQSHGLYYWCVPLSCTAQDSGSSQQQWGGVFDDGIVYCYDGCMSVFHGGGNGIVSLQFQNGDGASWGHFSSNGNRCSSPIDAGLLMAKKPAPLTCDHGSLSCYSPDKGFCAATESGEQVCTPAPPPGSGGCGVGATGATCAGNNAPPPTPPDPPIGKDSPPTSSGTATGTDSGGNTYNYTTNNYSGTSPGGGEPGSGSSSAGGSQSNSNGSGNSPGPNSSSGTDSSGKCSDGSVPTASGCSGTATDNGCNTPPQCYGDAVMCANFKENWATRCATQKLAAASSSSSAVNYGDPSAALAAAGVPADGGASGDPSASGLVSSSDLGEGGFDDSGLGFSRTCPANPSFSVFGRTYALDLTPFCNFASLFGWVVLLLSYLTALRIVSTGRA